MFSSTARIFARLSSLCIDLFFHIISYGIEVKQVGHIHLRNCEHILSSLKLGQSDLSERKYRLTVFLTGLKTSCQFFRKKIEKKDF